MAVIGIRCSNSDIAMCVVSGSLESPKLESKEYLQFPVGYTGPEVLNWLFQEMNSFFRRNECTAVGIKKAEPMVRRTNQFEDRVQSEGVVCLAAAQAGCRSISRKVKATIAKDLGLPGRSQSLVTQLDTCLIEGFDTYSSKLQDAILVAWSCLK